MWPFFNNFDNQDVEKRRPLAFTKLVESIGDFSDFTENNVALKTWLPEPVESALDELCQRNDDNVSEFLRKFLLIHCYGLYAYYVINEKLENIYQSHRSAPAFSRSGSSQKVRKITYWVPELGKNVAPIKVWIPTRLKADLQKLADHTGIKLSQYVREIIISRLLGYGMVPMRPEMLNAAPVPKLEEWCESDQEPEFDMKEVNQQEYEKSLLGEARVEYEDDQE